MYGYTTFHEKIMNTLINSVHDNTCSHAYIFEGAPGLFVHSSAALFAAALTCLDSAISPCGTCRSCIESKAETNPDIYHIVREKMRPFNSVFIKLGEKLIQSLAGSG